MGGSPDIKTLLDSREMHFAATINHIFPLTSEWSEIKANIEGAVDILNKAKIGISLKLIEDGGVLFLEHNGKKYPKLINLQARDGSGDLSKISCAVVGKAEDGEFLSHAFVVRASDNVESTVWKLSFAAATIITRENTTTQSERKNGGIFDANLSQILHKVVAKNGDELPLIKEKATTIDNLLISLAESYQKGIKEIYTK